MAKVRILQVGMDSNLGGIETYLLKVVTHCNPTLFHFDFLTFDSRMPYYYEELKELGCGFRNIRSRRSNWFGSKKDLRELLRMEQYDIIQCNLNSLSYIDPILEGIQCGSKVIAFSHNAGSGFGSSSKVLCGLNSCRFPYSEAILVACSEKAGRWMFGDRHDFKVLNNGIDSSRFRFSEKQREEGREELGIPMNSEVILHVGAFRPQKNHLFLIEVFRKYQDEHPDSWLLLVGTGDLLETVKAKVSDLGLSERVLFLGIRNDMDRILSISDKFLFPSLYEGFPIAMLEAQSSGLRCIASSDITKEVFLSNSTAVELNAPISEWTKALSLPNTIIRNEAWQEIEHVGLGLESDIRRLENLYLSLMREA